MARPCHRSLVSFPSVAILAHAYVPSSVRSIICSAMSKPLPPLSAAIAAVQDDGSTSPRRRSISPKVGQQDPKLIDDPAAWDMWILQDGADEPQHPQQDVRSYSPGKGYGHASPTAHALDDLVEGGTFNEFLEQMRRSNERRSSADNRV